MHRKYSVTTLAMTAIAFLIGGLIIASCLDMTPYSTAQQTESQTSGAATRESASPPVAVGGKAGVLPNFADLVEQLTPGVANISTTKVMKSPFASRRGRPGDPFEQFLDRFFQGRPQEFRQQSLGTGFVIDKDGYILTNNHVVDSADEIIVTLAGDREYQAKVIGKDVKTDIALIKIEPDQELPVLPIGDSDELRIGEWILAIGNPFGLQHTVTAGIVSAKGRVIGAGPYDDFIQVDASINPGNSGGPLIDSKGQVIGVNTAIYSNTGQSAGIGFAIPINLAISVANQLKNQGRVTRGWLGVLIQHIDPDLAKSYGMKSANGALVSKVVPNSPASKAGIQAGDVILSYDGKEIRHHSDLPVLVATTPPGEKARLQVIREGKRRNVSVTIEELEDESGEATESLDSDSESGRLGLRLQTVPPELAQEYGIKAGVLIAGVEPGSLAEQKGMQGGDVILEINGKKVNDVETFIKGVRGIDSGKLIRLLVRRGENQYFVAMPKP